MARPDSAVPANVTPEFNSKYREFKDARETSDKIRLLKELLSLAPNHKGAENLVGQLRRKLAKLKKKQEVQRRSGASTQKGIRKVAPLIVLVGPPNSGKTTLFKEFTGEGKPERHAYSTQDFETAIGWYDDARLQFIDCPSFDFNYANNADVVILTGRDKGLEARFPDAVMAEGKGPEEILEEVWTRLDLMRVYTDEGKEPMLLEKGATVEDAARDVHKTLVEQFEWAKVIRDGREYRVGLDFQLEEGDKVWIKGGP